LDGFGGDVELLRDLIESEDGFWGICDVDGEGFREEFDEFGEVSAEGEAGDVVIDGRFGTVAGEAEEDEFPGVICGGVYGGEEINGGGELGGAFFRRGIGELVGELL
jgi:hypothetical protein